MKLFEEERKNLRGKRGALFCLRIYYLLTMVFLGIASFWIYVDCKNSVYALCAESALLFLGLYLTVYMKNVRDSIHLRKKHEGQASVFLYWSRPANCIKAAWIRLTVALKKGICIVLASLPGLCLLYCVYALNIKTPAILVCAVGCVIYGIGWAIVYCQKENGVIMAMLVNPSLRIKEGRKSLATSSGGQRALLLGYRTLLLVGNLLQLPLCRQALICKTMTYYRNQVQNQGNKICNR